MKLGDIRNEKEDSFDLTFYKLWSFLWNQIENGTYIIQMLWNYGLL